MHVVPTRQWRVGITSVEHAMPDRNTANNSRFDVEGSVAMRVGVSPVSGFHLGILHVAATFC